MATKPALPPRLLTRDEVIQELVREIDADTLTVVSKRYDVSPSQLSDIRYGRANLSKRVLKQLRIRIHTYYEKVEKGGKL